MRAVVFLRKLRVFILKKKNYCGEKKFMEWLKCCKFPTAVEIELSMKNNHQKLEKKISCLMS